MMQVLEYILNNYTWFLIGIVLVLLAIIGYYADKTNFGQDKKNLEKENDSIGDDKKLTNVRLSDIVPNDTRGEVNNLEEKIEVSNINNDSSLTEKGFISNNNSLKTNDLNNVTLENNNDGVNESNIIETFSNSLQNNSDEIVEPVSAIPNPQNATNVVNSEDTLQTNEEKFNMFSEEFESLLPKKNIINTDLLSDIEDLEFDKTQKIDLSGLPDFDDIDLPKIMELSSDKDDIWNFK